MNSMLLTPGHAARPTACVPHFLSARGSIAGTRCAPSQWMTVCSDRPTSATAHLAVWAWCVVLFAPGRTLDPSPTPATGSLQWVCIAVWRYSANYATMYYFLFSLSVSPLPASALFAYLRVSCFASMAGVFRLLCLQKRLDRWR